MQRQAVALVRQAAKAAKSAGYTPVGLRAFSTTSLRFATEGKLPNKGPKGAAKSKLLHAIDSEVTGERNNEKEHPNDGRLEPLKAEGIWGIDEVAGNNNISLTRTMGTETIRVTFSCQPPGAMDPSMEDYGEGEEGETGIQEHDEAPTPDEQEGLEEEEPDMGEDMHFDAMVTVQKAGKPSLIADIVIGTSYVDIEAIRMVPAGQRVDIEAITQSTDYMGPHFDALDPVVQEEFLSWLDERGINAELFSHIDDAKAWKEQKEYVRWLGQVRSLLAS